jgi:aminopeptidase N
MRVGRKSPFVLALTAALFATPVLSTAATAGGSSHGHDQPPTPGAASAGDPYFPTQGNGGYDVNHYDLDVRYAPTTKLLTGTAGISAKATKALSRFNLDLRNNLRVSAVTVDGRKATFAQPVSAPTELVITPAKALRDDDRFNVVVSYGGIAKPVIDPDGSQDGWVPTPDGAIVTAEPRGAPSWYPCNDTPLDKATFDINITVPAGRTAISNGDFKGVRTSGGWSRWSWSEHDPMATYLATATNGIFKVSTGRTPGGVPYFNAVAPSLAAESAPSIAKLPAMIDYFSSIYGRYPFSSTGVIVMDVPTLGYALETQTRPVFAFAVDDATLSHELAHQWYGDGVSVRQWRDIWIAEGFAEFSAWYWSEHTGDETAQEYFDDLYATPAGETDFWNPPPANPGSGADIFDGSIYERGAMTLQALRVKLGDKTFFKVMKGWFAVGNLGNGTPAQFAVFASIVSGKNLAHFFDVWLYQEGKPTSW